MTIGTYKDYVQSLKTVSQVSIQNYTLLLIEEILGDTLTMTQKQKVTAIKDMLKLRESKVKSLQTEGKAFNQRDR
jgi:hypothetical protein